MFRFEGMDEMDPADGTATATLVGDRLIFVLSYGPGDALSILRAPADSGERLARRIAEIAVAHLHEVDPEEVAAVLYDQLDALEVEEVWDRARETRCGYVEPGEAADQAGHRNLKELYYERY